MSLYNILYRLYRGIKSKSLTLHSLKTELRKMTHFSLIVKKYTLPTIKALSELYVFHVKR